LRAESASLAISGRGFQPQSRAAKQRDKGARVSLQTASLARMHWRTDSAFSPSTKVYTGRPSELLLFSLSRIPSPRSLGTLIGE
jgi:hypothetical protein